MINYLFSSLMSIVIFCLRKTYLATDLSVHPSMPYSSLFHLLNRIVHLNNLHRFVRAWTDLSVKIICSPTFKIGVRQKIVILENFFFCLFRKFWPKDNMVQPILSLVKFWPKDNPVQLMLSFSKVLTKRQYGSTHIAF